MDYLDHHLLGLDSSEDIGSNSLVLDSIAKLLGYLIAYVGIKKGFPDIFNSLGDIYFGDPSLAFQYLERPFQSLAWRKVTTKK